MTKRRVLAMIIALMMCVFLCACKTTNTEKIENGGFVIVEKYNIYDMELQQFIMYDPDTMVMYTFIGGLETGGTSGGITVMYNADGTLKIYSPEEEKVN